MLSTDSTCTAAPDAPASAPGVGSGDADALAVAFVRPRGQSQRRPRGGRRSRGAARRRDALILPPGAGHARADQIRLVVFDPAAGTVSAYAPRVDRTGLIAAFGPLPDQSALASVVAGGGAPLGVGAGARLVRALEAGARETPTADPALPVAVGRFAIEDGPVAVENAATAALLAARGAPPDDRAVLHELLIDAHLQYQSTATESFVPLLLLRPDDAEPPAANVPREVVFDLWPLAGVATANPFFVDGRPTSAANVVAALDAGATPADLARALEGGPGSALWLSRRLRVQCVTRSALVAGLGDPTVRVAVAAATAATN